jgi:hypothetical protein
MACSDSQSRAARVFRWIYFDSAGAGRLHGKALRGWHHGAGVEGERAIDRILDLLHDGEHRGATGPYIADLAHQKLGLENVFRVSALSVFAMFFLVLLLFREPKRDAGNRHRALRAP